MTTPSRLLPAALAALACALLASPDAGAVVPPRDCGSMIVKGRKYQVKVDQIACARGRAYAKAYLARGTKPRGYRCRNFRARKGRVRFNCVDGRRIFFAIRR